MSSNTIRFGSLAMPGLLALALAGCGGDAVKHDSGFTSGGVGGAGKPSDTSNMAAAGSGPAGSPAAGGGGGTSQPVAGDGATQPDAGGPAVFPPPPPPYAIFVPPHDQPPGDPARGWDYLVNGEYQRLGPDLAAFKQSAPPIAAGDVLPGRHGDNENLSYMFNAATGDDGTKVAAVNCLGCHATHLLGKLIIGLGRPNRMVRLDDVNVIGIAFANPFAIGSSTNTLGRLLGGVNLGVMDVFPYLASHRDPKTLVWGDMERFNPDAGVQGWVDIAPWWRTKKKNALYSNGAGRGYQSHHMGFMSIFSVKDTTEAAVIEKNFYDVAAYLRSIEPPKFPGPIDAALAAQGEGVFVNTCSTCHGTYGKEVTYPNVIIPYAEVGTDPSLATGHWTAPTVDWYAQSWYAREGKSWLEITEGYYAPPLDGVWATAPFFHNGSVPTLDGVIDPSKRPATSTSNMSEDDFNLDHVGWMNKPLDTDLTVSGDNGTFDVSKPGNSNQGHTYGAGLSASDQRALLEYLKTL